MILEEKLQQLRAKYTTPEDQRTITDWEKALRRKIVEERLTDIEAVKDIVADAKEKVKEINTLLAYDAHLTDSERQALFKERAAHQFYLERFGAWNAGEFVEALERMVDEKLK